MTSTPRLGLPLLSPGQAQKELFHNEALHRLDALAGAAVEDEPMSTPPPAPGTGQCFLIGPDPIGDWAGHEHSLALWTGGGWRFVDPPEGLSVYVRTLGHFATFRLGAWEFGSIHGSKLVLNGEQIVGERCPAVPSPIGGKVVDAEARTAIDEILARMRQHGLIES